MVDVSCRRGQAKTSYEFPLPVYLEAPLSRYLAVYRPILENSGSHRGTTGSALWISRDGGTFTQFGIRQVTGRLTKAAFGKSINPHLFRDCAATMIAIDDPGNAHIIPGVPGHSGPETAERHYNQAGNIQAMRRYHGALLKVRTDAKRFC